MLNDCLKRGLRILETECNGWPKMNDYLETLNEDINYDKTIKISLKQHTSFKSVIMFELPYIKS